MRMRVSRTTIHVVSRSITTRDKQICLAVYEHRFLTTHQAARLFFSSDVRARVRLHHLWLLRVLERFRPERATGSFPWYYVLDEIGIAVCESLLAVERLAYDRRKALALVYSPHLLHMTEANDFFTHLAQAGSRNDLVHVDSWLGERSSRELWRGAIRPDGFAVLRTVHGQLGLALELDGGTEDGKRLSDKLADYATLAGAADAPHLIAFCFPSAEREAAQRLALEGCPIPVATAVLETHVADPLGHNWLLVPGRQRVSLSELAARLRHQALPKGEAS